MLLTIAQHWKIPNWLSGHRKEPRPFFNSNKRDTHTDIAHLKLCTSPVPHFEFTSAHTLLGTIILKTCGILSLLGSGTVLSCRVHLNFDITGAHTLLGPVVALYGPSVHLCWITCLLLLYTPGTVLQCTPVFCHYWCTHFAWPSYSTVHMKCTLLLQNLSATPGACSDQWEPKEYNHSPITAHIFRCQNPRKLNHSMLTT